MSLPALGRGLWSQLLTRTTMATLGWNADRVQPRSRDDLDDRTNRWVPPRKLAAHTISSKLLAMKRSTLTRIPSLVCLLIATALAGCTHADNEVVTLTILYTNDEHGWMAPTETHGGAAGMVQRWRADEGYTPEDAFLILSGGDLWTGPALSTWFEGESMVDVMNAMGYHAAAVGNHEFDFGVSGLAARAAQAEFALLGANVRATSEDFPEAILSYIVQEAAPGLQVGIIGLASQGTPQTTMPTHVAGLHFADYDTTLVEVVPQVRDAGADVVVVISHLCEGELTALAPTARSLGVAMLGGGHCHEEVARVEEGLAIIVAGSRLEAYGRVDLGIAPRSREVVDVSAVLKPNPLGPGDGEIEALVARWQAELDEALLVTIGYTERGIARNSAGMHSLVTNAWLTAYPADVAMSNPGGFRQDIDPGEITLADVVGVLPFDNTLIDVTLTGQQLLASYLHGSRRPAVTGLTQEGGRYLVGGDELDPDGACRVLVNDYMAAGGDGYAFAEYDPDAYNTGIDWRQPVIEWISALDTSPENPLEHHLAAP